MSSKSNVEKISITGLASSEDVTVGLNERASFKLQLKDRGPSTEGSYTELQFNALVKSVEFVTKSDNLHMNLVLAVGGCVTETQSEV